MTEFIYQGAKTSQISFPLGGIGTGCIGLAGNGRLIDWEIFNRPNKGSVNGFSHFAIRAERDGKVLAARVLHGDLPAPYQGELHGTRFSSFGWGPAARISDRPAPFPERRFPRRISAGRADLSRSESFPGQVQLLAFNPFIPLNADDSSIPAAFFEFSITNSTAGADRPTRWPAFCATRCRPTISTPWTDHAWGHALQRDIGRERARSLPMAI